MSTRTKKQKSKREQGQETQQKAKGFITTELSWIVVSPLASLYVLSTERLARCLNDL
jgi:hypothetical protein